MSDTTVPCVSLATGGLERDLRVNYQLGMMLGLDEFRQEALYFLEKEYQHNRALHGFGTVYGLKVEATHPNPPGEVTITVQPGMAIDQWGRVILLRSAQCAHLGAWVADQAHKQDALESHASLSGEMTVYVVASYSECLDMLKPVPGQPCSSGEDLSAPSRIRDSWNLELRWAPPKMTAWDKVRKLAKLLDSIELVEGMTGSDEELIKAEVRALTTDEPTTPSLPMSSIPPGPAAYRLPAEGAAEVFDRILLVWVTEVRPLLEPTLTDPELGNSDPAVLLATVTFVPEDPFNDTAPAIVHCKDPLDDGRPFLLNTQLIQQLHGVRSEIQVPSAQLPPPKPVQLVTVSSRLNQGRLVAWFHLNQPVKLTSTVPVSRRTSSGTVSETQLFGTLPVLQEPPNSGRSSLWFLIPPPKIPLQDGELIEAAFPAQDVTVGPTAAPLASIIAASGVELLDHEKPDKVRAFTQVEIPPASPQIPPAPPTVASVEFVTISSLQRQFDKPLIFQLWFHPNPVGSATIIRITNLSVSVSAESASGSASTPIALAQQSPAQSQVNVWTLSPTGSWNGNPQFLRFVFNIDATRVLIPNSTSIPLSQYITQTGIRFLGWNGGGQISAYHWIAARTVPM